MHRTGALLVLCFFLCSCGGVPSWVAQCATPAKSQQGKVLACGMADVFEGDVDSALDIASTEARAKLADFVLKTRKKEFTQKARVELQGTRIQAEWVAQGKVYALVDMDVELAKSARITEGSSQSTTKSSSKEKLTPAGD